MHKMRIIIPRYEYRNFKIRCREYNDTRRWSSESLILKFNFADKKYQYQDKQNPRHQSSHLAVSIHCHRPSLISLVWKYCRLQAEGMTVEALG